MGDDSLIPISDEQAKLGRDIVDASRGLAGYLKDVFGDLPHDLVGLLADRVKFKRAEQLDRLWKKTKQRLKGHGASPEAPSLKLVLPILAAAADENREELQDLWAGLLAAAMDPQRQTLVRQSLIRVVREMDPLDALVLREVVALGTANWQPNPRTRLIEVMNRPQEEVLVSLDNLERLKCISYTDQVKASPVLAPLGQLLIRAVS